VAHSIAAGHPEPTHARTLAPSRNSRTRRTNLRDRQVGKRDRRGAALTFCCHIFDRKGLVQDVATIGGQFSQKKTLNETNGYER
jgi:hypothetical protein